MSIQPPTTAAGVSPSSVSHWCFMGAATVRMLVCAACDVSWNETGGDTCWVCGDAGVRVRELRRHAGNPLATSH